MNTATGLTPSRVKVAAERLSKGAGTYLKRHAYQVVIAACCVASAAEAVDSVRSLVGHTSVGERNAEKWALAARKFYLEATV